MGGPSSHYDPSLYINFTSHIINCYNFFARSDEMLVWLYNKYAYHKHVITGNFKRSRLCLNDRKCMGKLKSSIIPKLDASLLVISSI